MFKNSKTYQILGLPNERASVRGFTWSQMGSAHMKITPDHFPSEWEKPDTILVQVYPSYQIICLRYQFLDLLLLRKYGHRRLVP